MSKALALVVRFVLAAVSPAVVVPGMLCLQRRGYGIEKGVPTLVTAAAGVDDVFAISAYGVVNGIAFAKGIPILLVNIPIKTISIYRSCVDRPLFFLKCASLFCFERSPSFLFSFVLGAVSPAVVVPSMLMTQAKGLGVDHARGAHLGPDLGRGPGGALRAGARAPRAAPGGIRKSLWNRALSTMSHCDPERLSRIPPPPREPLPIIGRS